ncbi:homocysteine S-methyltransferase [Actinopolyspora mortivallis]|uniref:Homocysteine S-methyltransferase n=1 Tax=Actinopolyspora mortivallis TaxID=33906 RepID=A0A2T0GRD1_ACTMO|nr:homocysteine S-methyltransferase [Actinopolyspora mortivallis]PRW61647.1 homocysteine S-methyltransferase [Actinopolyspora mortivallis]
MDFLDSGEQVLVTDGGLATELEARGHDLSDALWSARLLADAPEEIVAAHRAFFRAGAVVATTATYQASFEGFAARGLDRKRTLRLLRRGVEAAETARAEVSGDGRRRWVAASVGPYGAFLADGSEYRGRYGLSVRELRDWHRPRLEALAESGADLLALETVPDLDEGRALVELAAATGFPAWLSYTVEHGRTRAGQPMSEAFAVAAGVPEILAVGVNCCAPEEVPAAVEAARAATGKPVIAYPNSGEGWDPTRRDWIGPGSYTAERARGWVAEGARVVGGCCRVGPAEIAELAGVVREAE